MAKLLKILSLGSLALVSHQNAKATTPCFTAYENAKKGCSKTGRVSRYEACIRRIHRDIEHCNTSHQNKIQNLDQKVDTLIEQKARDVVDPLLIKEEQRYAQLEDLRRINQTFHAEFLASVEKSQPILLTYKAQKDETKRLTHDINEKLREINHQGLDEMAKTSVTIDFLLEERRQVLVKISSDAQYIDRELASLINAYAAKIAEIFGSIDHEGISKTRNFFEDSRKAFTTIAERNHLLLTQFQNYSDSVKKRIQSRVDGLIKAHVSSVVTDVSESMAKAKARADFANGVNRILKPFYETPKKSNLFGAQYNRKRYFTAKDAVAKLSFCSESIKRESIYFEGCLIFSGRKSLFENYMKTMERHLQTTYMILESQSDYDLNPDIFTKFVQALEGRDIDLAVTYYNDLLQDFDAKGEQHD